MLTCVLCGEQHLWEEDMKTHLLLAHAENQASCPLCSLSGVSYDELSYHVNTEHREPGGGGGGAPRSAPSSPSSVGQGYSDGSAIPSPSSRDGGSEATEATPPLDEAAAEPRRSGAPGPPGGRAASVGGVAPSAPTSRGLDTARDAVRRRVEEGGGRAALTAERRRVKHRRLSSPRRDVTFPCPLCALVCSDGFTLQEHVELHLQEQDAPEGARMYVCPICSIVCEDSFILQQHVEVHFDGAVAAGSAVSPDSDLRLARRLQQEEDEKRRGAGVKQEAEEFKKLKETFGLDRDGGYRRQLEKTMEKAVSRGVMAPADFHNKRVELMESLASGVDDGKTRTQGTLGALYEHFQRAARDCVHVWLSAETDHFCSSAGDRGWGCGYRNLQMLLSALQRIETFAHCLPAGPVPGVPRLQSMIEAAWKDGMDPQGASHFNHRLQGTRAWIGATEIYALLTSLGVRARITDFHKPTGPGDTHPRLFEWVKDYFSESFRGARLPPRVVRTSQPPLYLQHQGHSRTIVGVEERKNGSICLLIVDPGWSPSDARKLLSQHTAPAAVRRVRRLPGTMKHKQYQVVAVDGVLSPEDKRIRIQSSGTLQAERIP